MLTNVNLLACDDSSLVARVIFLPVGNNSLIRSVQTGYTLYLKA